MCNKPRICVIVHVYGRNKARLDYLPYACIKYVNYYMHDIICAYMCKMLQIPISSVCCKLHVVSVLSKQLPYGLRVMPI